MYAQPPQEQMIYQDGQVTVTTARFVVGPTLYPIRGITAVQPIVIPANRGNAIAVGLAASAMLVLGVATSSPGVGGVGVILALVAVGLWMAAHPVYIVRVWTAGGQVDAVSSNELVRIQTIVSALHRATMGM